MKVTSGLINTNVAAPPNSNLLTSALKQQQQRTSTFPIRIQQSHNSLTSNNGNGNSANQGFSNMNLHQHSAAANQSSNSNEDELIGSASEFIKGILCSLIVCVRICSIKLNKSRVVSVILGDLCQPKIKLDNTLKLQLKSLISKFELKTSVI